MMTRRQALKTTALAALAYPGAQYAAQITVQPKTNLTNVGTPRAMAAAPTGPVKLAPLPYAYDALEPYISAETMRFHHDMHHAAYVANFNRAIAGHQELVKEAAQGEPSVEAMLRDLSKVPEAIRTAVRNQGGGVVNHALFFQEMSKNAVKHARGELNVALGRRWSTFEGFKEAFDKAAMDVFGSGWAWLTLDRNKQLHIETTANQDSPLMNQRTPLLGLDVWEHAYYLQYKNRRQDYINAFHNVLNWDIIGQRFAKLMA